jgi:hypothetical protein
MSVNDEGMAKMTTDHEEIRRWVEQRGGRPARVKGTGDDDAGLLRIDFGEPDEKLEAINWDEWFTTFDHSDLAFLYEDEPESRFNKLVSRETAGQHA